MRRTLLKLRNRRGFTLVLTAFMSTILIGSAAFAIDMGRMYLYRAQLHSAADAAALAGALQLELGSSIDASDSAFATAQRQYVGGVLVPQAAVSVTPGWWTTTTPFASGAWAGANSDSVRVTYTASFTFGRLFGLTTKVLSATSIAAVGSVDGTNCVRPLAIPYQSLLDQIYPPGNPGYPMSTSHALTAADIAALKGAHTETQLKAGDAGSSPVNGSFYLIEMGPYANSAGTLYPSGTTWGGNNIFGDRFAGNCANSPWTIHVGDWLLGKQGNANGPMQQAFDQKCGTNISGNNNTYLCNIPLDQRSIKVALWSAQDATMCNPRCYQVKYLGEFVITKYTTSSGSNPDGLWGYFTSVASDGSFSTSINSPLQKLALVR